MERKKMYLILIIICAVGIGLYIYQVVSLRYNVKKVNEITGLQFSVSDIKSVNQAIKSIPDGKSYYYFAKISIDKSVYLKIVQKSLINKLDTSNLAYKRTFGAVFSNPNIFWEIPPLPTEIIPLWWDLGSVSDPEMLFANVLSDFPNKEIGNAHSFTGKIISYYRTSYCYIFVENR